MSQTAIDAEIIELVDALNAFEGISTYSSCSGHGKAPVRVWFHADSIQALFPVLRAIDPRYGGPSHEYGYQGHSFAAWYCLPCCTDLPGAECVTFLLYSLAIGAGVAGSRETTGLWSSARRAAETTGPHHEAAIAEAQVVARNLWDIATDATVCKMFGLKLKSQETSS